MSAITAILNCYQPLGGRNATQVVLRAGGEAVIYGDEALGRKVIGDLVNGQIRVADAEPPAGERGQKSQTPSRLRPSAPTFAPSRLRG